MRNQPLIQTILQPRALTIPVGAPWERTALRVALPDLRDAPRDEWGDWGPMYRISVSPDDPVRFAVVRDSSRDQGEALDVGSIELSSPFLAATRERTPLVLRLPIPPLGLELRVAFDGAGEPAEAALEPVSGSSPGLFARQPGAQAPRRALSPAR